MSGIIWGYSLCEYLTHSGHTPLILNTPLDLHAFLAPEIATVVLQCVRPPCCTAAHPHVLTAADNRAARKLSSIDLNAEASWLF